MFQLDLSNSAQRDDEYYREQWRAFYTERRRILRRVLWLACGFGVLFSLLFVVLDKHPFLGDVLAVPTVILMLALPAQWFIFLWRMRTWTCPRCGDSFFAPALANNPFGTRCRHCGLVRPKQSEIDHFHYEDKASRAGILGG
jgi:hypothetical protein